MCDLRALADQLAAVDVAAHARHDQLLLLGATTLLQKRLLDADADAAEVVGAEDDDEYSTVKEAAGISRMSKDWFYRRADELPFVRRFGRKLLINKKGLLRWMERAGRAR